MINHAKYYNALLGQISWPNSQLHYGPYCKALERRLINAQKVKDYLNKTHSKTKR